MTIRSGLFRSLALQTSGQFARLNQSIDGAASPAGQRIWFSNQGPEDTVDARRRRRSSGPSGRAEMPSHPSGRDSGGRPPTGGGLPPTYSGGGGSRPGGRKLPFGLVILILVLYFAFSLFSGGGEETPAATVDLANQQPTVNQMEELAQPTRTPRPAATRAPAATGSGQTWTVMMYQDADDQILEQDIYLDLNEAEKVGSNERVNIIAQVDRFQGGYPGDGNWTNTRRYQIVQDDDLERVTSPVLEDLGEVNMGDTQTLVDFVAWGVKNFPADKYVLILSDHGMGWPGGFSDPAPRVQRRSSIPLAGVIGNQIYLMDLDQALGEIRQQTGIDQFEMIGLDACLMAQVEVFSALAPHARYAVASQETEPALGWAYTSFLTSLSANPDIDGAALGELIVDSYIDDDQRVVDDQARAAFLRQGSPMGGLFGGFNDIGPERLARQLSQGITLTAVDLAKLPAVVDNLNDLAYALQSDNQSITAKARTYAQSFTSIFGEKVPPSYIDLGHFAKLLYQESNSRAVRSSAEALQAAIGQFVVAEKHGPGKKGATGVSVYFPNSQLYGSNEGGPRSYTAIADRFSTDTLWDDFLAYHYAKRPFEPATQNAVIPDAGSRLQVPGAGQIEISPLQVSAKETDLDTPVVLQARLSGQNIGYVYLFVGYFDPQSRSILVADYDYLESPSTRQVGELFYPAWSDNESFNLRFEWLPTVFAISDGENTVVTALNPERYGAAPEDAVYTVDGVYTYTTSGEQRKARLYFRDGQLRQVYGFTGEGETGAPREIIPQAGDTFTINQQWLESDANGKYAPNSLPGETLTFGSQMFTWEELYAAAGDYVLGYVVTDLDGNSKQSFGQVRVR